MYDNSNGEWRCSVRSDAAKPGTMRSSVRTSFRPSVTSVTLLGQWYDEITKYAPTLVVKVCHSSSTPSSIIKGILKKHAALLPFEIRTEVAIGPPPGGGGGELAEAVHACFSGLS